MKFRESEELQLLTAHRQSGGERSVSTILYLIALQVCMYVWEEWSEGGRGVSERSVGGCIATRFWLLAFHLAYPPPHCTPDLCYTTTATTPELNTTPAITHNTSQHLPLSPDYRV